MKQHLFEIDAVPYNEATKNPKRWGFLNMNIPFTVRLQIMRVQGSFEEKISLES